MPQATLSRFDTCFGPTATSASNDEPSIDSDSDGRLLERRGDVPGPGVDVVPIAEVAVGRAKGADDDLLAEAEAVLVEASREGAVLDGALAAIIAATSVGSSTGLGGSPIGPLEKSQTRFV